MAGQTGNAAPVMALVTQFGGGKTHTLTTLYHLVRGKIGIDDLRRLSAGGPESLLGQSNWLDEFKTLPKAKVAVFVGNAWDPQEGAETPWIDVARQLAGEAGVKAVGKNAKTTPPGTTSLSNVFAAADAPVLVLFDEVLNFLNRHRDFSDGFYAFIQNLTVSMTGTTHGVAMISLPRSQVEMTPWDQEWQAKITKVVKRVAKDLIVNDEGEIAEVVRRRLFEDVGSERVQKAAKAVAKAYADWCFDKRAQLPPEWTAVDTAATDAKAKDFLRGRFEACYPFHPATLSVFQRKWQTLAQYQQTRGTLAMFAQWVSWAFMEQHQKNIAEPLLTLGRAPLHDPNFVSVVLGQLGEPRLGAAITTDIAGQTCHAKGLDADTKGALRDIHRRVGLAILFESSGGQAEKVAHLPELRFALGEPGLDTTSIDNAAVALEKKGYFIRKAGTDGFRFGFQPTLKKVVADRRASLDEDEDIRKPTRNLVKREFEQKATLPLVPFPVDGDEVADTARLTVILLDPDTEWDDRGELRKQIAQWTLKRGSSNRLYPGSLVWCVRKAGKDQRQKVEYWQAWRKVQQEINEGTLPGEFERTDLAKVASELSEAADGAADEVWASYRFMVIADPSEKDGVKAIDLAARGRSPIRPISPALVGSRKPFSDGGQGFHHGLLGAGHSSAGQSLTERVIVTLKSGGLLNESVRAGYLERNWPPALKESGAWPLSSMRQAFLNGALTRLADPDKILREKIVEFVAKGDFGLASGQKSDGTFERVWFDKPVGPEEVIFDAQVFLLTKQRAKRLVTTPSAGGGGTPPVGGGTGKGEPAGGDTATGEKEPVSGGDGKTPVGKSAVSTIRLSGQITPEVWNKLGVRILPRLKSGAKVQLGIDFTCEVGSADAAALQTELKQAIADLRLENSVSVSEE